MKKRQLDLIQYLYQYQYITLDDALKKNDISKRTFYYDLRDINDFLMPIGEIKRVDEFFIFVGETKKLRALLKQHGVSTDSEDRTQQLLYQILNQTFQTIEKETDRYEVSKNTIVNSLNEMKKYLQTLDLSIHYDETYQITGEERKVRELYMQLMANDKTLIQVMDERVIQFNQKSGLQLTDYSIATLSKFIQFLELRIKHAHFITEVYKAHEAKYFSYYNMLSDYFPFVTGDEKAYLTLYISTLASMKTTVSKQQINRYVDRMMERFEKISATKLSNKESFRKNIARHLQSSYYRIKYRFPSFNPLLYEIQTKNQYLFKIVEKTIVQSEISDLQHMREEEIGYLVMYFGAYLKKRPKRNTRAIIVCPNGLVVSKTLELQLYDTIPNIDIVGQVSLHALENFKEPYDVIISTIDLKGFDSVIVVNPILTQSDISTLLEVFVDLNSFQKVPIIESLLSVINENCTIHDPKKLEEALYRIIYEKKEKREYQPMLKELLTRNYMNKIESCKDWKEAIRIASKPLINDHLIDEIYVDHMIDSVLTHGPYIVLDDGFALPHASTHDGVHSICMSLLYVKNPVDLLGKSVNVFVVLATPDKNIHLKALAELSDLLNHEEYFNIFLSGDLDRINEIIQKNE